MAPYEFRVIPAPTKGQKVRGLKGNEARFAHTIEETMNDMAADGWEYQRADTLPMEVREGLRGTKTVFQTLLVFRRPTGAAAAQPVAAPSVEEAGDTPAPTGEGNLPEPKELKAERAKTTITNVRVSPKIGTAKLRNANDESPAPFEPDEPELTKDDSPGSVLTSRARQIFAGKKDDA